MRLTKVPEVVTTDALRLQGSDPLPLGSQLLLNEDGEN
jgi:hypothetical protein